MAINYHDRNAIARVLPKQIPNERWIPIIVPARPRLIVVSSLPYFIPTVVR